MTRSPPETEQASSGKLRSILLAVSFAAAYLLAAEIGHLLSFEPGHVATFWPPSGLFLMVLTIVDKREWKYYLLAACVANVGSDLANGKVLPWSLAMTSANILEAVVGAWFLRYKATQAFSLERPDDVQRLMLTAIIAPLISAVIPSLAFMALNLGRFQDVYVVWWLADCVGIFIVSPIVWALVGESGLKRVGLWRSLELLACFMLVTSSTVVIFSEGLQKLSFPFLLMPLLFWPAIRFGTVAVACHIAIMAVIISIFTRLEMGTFAHWLNEPTLRAMIVQAFLATISAPFLILAAMWHQRSMEAEELERRISLRTKQLADADRRKDHFLAVLAHELRNPLAPLSHALDVWPSAIHDWQRLEDLRQIMTSQVNHMTGLIDDLLDVSRIAGGKILLRQARVDMCDVVRTAIRAVQSQAEQAGHIVRVQLPPEPIWVQGDRARLCQIIGNLLNNAIKYTGSEGVIKVHLLRSGETCEVRVEDNGPGIPQKDLQRIFELFTQVDQTLERSHGGLGIGLTLVQNLVELHGGRVEAASAGPGQGSCFTVHLPCLTLPATSPSVTSDSTSSQANSSQANDSQANDSPATSAPTMSSATDLPERRILVVDDTHASGRMLGMLLKSLGQQVELCYDGPSALQTVPTYQPSLIFLDIAMPGMNGYEVATQLKANPSTAHITLIAMTGFGQESDRQRAFASGFDHHLIKPANLDSLKQVIREPATK